MSIVEPVKIIKAETEQEKEILKAEIWHLLDKANKMVLAYVNENKEPVQSIMLYIIDDELNIYFGTLKRFPKYEHLVQNPPLSIMVSEEGKLSQKAVSIKASIIKEIDDEAEKRKILKWFDEKNTCKYFIKDQDDFVLFKAKILSARLLDASSGRLIRKDLLLV